ncbi:MAG: EamA family transporter [Actinobacteria bacterium]|uniref:Unannotated protein n=1 Tax=freshwater metagenome TaxID=449393 RepID=A0A6J5YRQ7_9ZZZZ|nr:EamA family transporter [Actinomycetota bacterium]
MTTNRKAVLFTLLSGVFFGTSGTAQAIGPAGLTPMSVSAARLICGGILLAALMPTQGHKLREVLPLFRMPSAYIAAACVCLFQIFYFTATARAGVALGTLIAMGSMPLITGLIGTIFGHKISSAWFIATLVCVLGLILLARDGIASGSVLGIVSAVLSATAGAGFNLAVKYMLDQNRSALPSLVTVFLIAAILMVPIAATQPLNWVASASGLSLILWLGLVTMAIPNIFWLTGIGHLSPGTTATLVLGEPFTATLLGVFVLHETLELPAIIGLFLVLFGIVMLGYVEARTPKSQVAATNHI